MAEHNSTGVRKMKGQNEERDVIGEVIEEDKARMIPPALAEYAVQSVAELQAAIAKLEADNRSKNGNLKAFGEQIGKLQRAVKNRDRIIGQRDARIEELEASVTCLSELQSALQVESDRLQRCKRFESLYAESERELAALKAQQSGGVVPEELFDGYAVYSALSEKAAYRTSQENVSDVLDAVVPLMRARLNSSLVSAGWMMPTAQQIEQALDSVPGFQDLSAELIAPAMLEHLRDVISAGEYGDAYQGAREDLAIWKRRALEAETRIREQDRIIENMGDALNAENGPTFMGEPVLSGAAPAYRSHTTTPGESVAGIALRQLGDESRWVEVRDLNAHAFPDIGPHEYYPVGTVLRLPAAAPNHGEQVRQMEPNDPYDWSVFPGYLLDYCEREEVGEEMLQRRLADMLADPHYGALFRREKTAYGKPVDHALPIATAIEAAEEEHGSLRAAAKAMCIDAGYLSRLKSGEKLNPSDNVLSALGLERVTMYRAAAPSAQQKEGE